MHILLIEDNPFDAELFEFALQDAQLDCKLTHVEALPQLQQALQQPAPDAVVCDGQLIGFDGNQALQWVRACWPEVAFFFCLGGDAFDCLLSKASMQTANAVFHKDQMDDLAAHLRALATRDC